MKLKKKITPFSRLAAGLLIVALGGCLNFTHRVHQGALGEVTASQTQWFALFGLVKLNNVDTHQLAGNHRSYVVETGVTFTDLVLSPIFLPLTIIRQTVIVKK